MKSEHTQKALGLRLTRFHEIIMDDSQPNLDRELTRDVASIQVVSYLSTPAYYVIYNTVNRFYYKNCSGVLIKVFHMNMQVPFDSWCQSL